MQIDNTILKDMVDTEKLEAVLEAFGTVCGIGSGIFTPLGKRIGKPAHHSPYCELIASTSPGKAACDCCDNEKVTAIIEGDGMSSPYECHAHLIDFCEPVYRGSGEKRRLIGVFFGGQLRDEKNPITGDTIKSVLDTAKKYGIGDANELVARYMRVPQCSEGRIDDLRNWMKHFAHLIGLLVEKKANTQRLLLDVIRSGDDQHEILQAVHRGLLPAAVSLLLRRPEFCAEGEDRIFLVATTYARLAAQLGVDPSNHDLSYAPGEGFTGYVYAKETPILIPNICGDGNYQIGEDVVQWRHKVKEIPDETKTKSFIAVPVRSEEGTTIGVLRAVRVRRQPEFTNDDLELLVGIASVVRVAVSKAESVKTQAERVRSLLDSLADPTTTLDSVTDRMAEMLGEPYVKRGPWETAHIVRHLDSQKEFLMLGVYPPGRKTKGKQEKGLRYPETTGVAGHMLKTRKSFAHHDCPRSEVLPAIDWKCVAAAPIVHRGKFWGAVTLCGNDVPKAAVDEAKPEVERFAKQMSSICRLSETLETKTGATEAIARLVSLSVVLHDIHNDLERAKVTVDRLQEDLEGEEKKTVADLAKLIHANLGWMSVCQALGRFIASCRRSPETAADEFWRERVAEPPEIDVEKLVRDVLEEINHLEGKYKTKVDVTIEANTIVVGDENMLFHALRNLLENGFVWGSRTEERASDIRMGVPVKCHVTATKDETETCIQVQDEGEGMSLSALTATKEVYDDPTRLGRLALGLGFGTMITAFVAKVHGGHVSVESERGRGTTVRFTLPSRSKERRN